VQNKATKNNPGTVRAARGVKKPSTQANPDSTAGKAPIPTLTAALTYAARGWPVFPVPPGSKKSYKKAKGNGGASWGMTTDAAQIQKDWRHWPKAGVGIATGAPSHIFVLEIDTKAGHDVDGAAALRALEQQHGTLPPTLQARSPSGSIHYYFKHPGHGIKIKNSASELGPGIDVRGDGGMVVAPPTRRKDGVYCWQCDQNIAEAPPWLLDLTTQRSRERTNGHDDEPPATMEQIAAAVAAIPNPNLGWESWNRIAMVIWAATRGSAAGFTLFDTFSQHSEKYNADKTRERWDAITGCPPDQLTVGTLFYEADRADPFWYAAQGTEGARPSASANSDNGRPAEQVSPLPFIDMSRWDVEPVPEQEWAVEDRVPLRETTLFTGEGGGGKSTSALHLCAATVLARDWLGAVPNIGPAIFVDVEDHAKVIHRRLACVTQHYQIGFRELISGGLHLISLHGEDAVLATVSRSGKIEPTRRYQQMLEAAGDIKPRIITIASAANVFAGNENDRPQVQQFIGLCTRLAITANGSVVLIAHPSLTGINTETGLSGSTQWHNGPRARFFLRGVKAASGEQPDNDLREIIFKKNQYGPISEKIVLRYQNGMFLPEPGVSFDRAEREAQADDVFLALLRRFISEGRKVCHKAQANNYAVTAFAKEPEALAIRLSRDELASAMRRLFAAGKLKAQPYGRPDRDTSHLIITT
jgi:RecA-family ATPase